MKEQTPFDALMTYALTPLSWIYGAAVTVRNKLFDFGILKQTKFDIPVISVGNITVGGTGKTPHVEYLLTKMALDYRVAVVSRGYKRKTKGFLLANSKSTPETIGDEPYQIYQKFGHRVVVAVSESRRKGIMRLRELHPEVNLIILDDAFQHRYVKPTLSILLVDFMRPTWSDKLLPLGRLRENWHAVDRADIVVVTKCKDSITPLDVRMTRKGLDLLAFQRNYFSVFDYEPIKPVFPDDMPYDVLLSQLTSRDSVLLLTGIAQPRSFIRYFRNYPFKTKVAHFPDHHEYTRADLEKISAQFDAMKGERKIIVTTEKDAVRLVNNPYFPEILKPVVYYLPVKVRMLQDVGDGDFIQDVYESIGKPENSIADNVYDDNQSANDDSFSNDDSGFDGISENDPIETDNAGKLSDERFHPGYRMEDTDSRYH